MNSSIPAALLICISKSTLMCSSTVFIDYLRENDGSYFSMTKHHISIILAVGRQRFSINRERAKERENEAGSEREIPGKEKCREKNVSLIILRR